MEERVERFLSANPEYVSVDKKAFLRCNERIQPLLDDALLFDLLMGHLKASLSEEEAMRLKSSSKQPHERHLALLNLAEKGGTCGYMQLFICICETFEEAPGHSQAAKILQGK